MRTPTHILLFAAAKHALANYVIPFLPAPAENGFHNETLLSWGGGVVAAGGAFHLFASAFVNNCTLQAWTSNSIAIHAVGASPLGPFSFVERALPFYHHNVQPVVAPDGTFLIFSIGMVPDPTPVRCHAGAGALVPPPPPLSSTHGFESVECWSAPSVHGPWSPVSGNVNGRNLFNGTNPSPAFDPSGNGTIYVMSHAGANMTVAVASSWRGPYSPAVPVFSHAVGDFVGEDPVLWWDSTLPNSEGSTGAWRVLWHAYNKSDPGHQFNVGGYAVSAGANIFGAWYVQDPRTAPAYTTEFTSYVSGAAGPTKTTTFGRRERPKLWRDPSTGAPACLYSGVCPVGSARCFTIAAPIQT